MPIKANANPVAAHDPSPKMRPNCQLLLCCVNPIAKLSHNISVRQDYRMNRMNRIFKQNRILSILFILSKEIGLSAPLFLHQ
ncbi:MAG: hypothetical protein WC556_08800 [Candidatus Methanoperedens sp.]